MMKMTLLAVVLGFAVANAQAGDKVGRASFTFWGNNGDIASVDIWENSDGSIGGQSGFSQNGMFNLKAKNGGWKGYADDGFVEASCSGNECEGQIGSGSFDLTVSEGGQKLRGVLNHVSIRAKITDDEIEFSGDGSIEMDSDNGRTYSGRGQIGWGIGSVGDARLKLEGTMIERVKNDPVLFTTFLIAPIVRNGI